MCGADVYASSDHGMYEMSCLWESKAIFFLKGRDEERVARSGLTKAKGYFISHRRVRILQRRGTPRTGGTPWKTVQLQGTAYVRGHSSGGEQVLVA